jgi:hypothetical protein
MAQFNDHKSVDESKMFHSDDEDHESEIEESEEEIDEIGPKKSEKEKGCRCGRTKCLKQYCACFRTDQRCTSDCGCQDCRNDGKHETERMLAVRHVRMHSNTAFKGTRLAASDQQVVTPRGSVRILRGCKCKKSRCQKKVRAANIWGAYFCLICGISCTYALLFLIKFLGSIVNASGLAYLARQVACAWTV